MKLLKKKIIFNLTLILLIGIGCLLVAEISSRLYLVFSGKGGYIWLPDYYLGRVHAPNSHFLYKEDFSQEFLIRRKTNSLGFIGEEITIEKPENVFRILVLGDSFTEALQVEEGKNFCEQLQYLLNHESVLRDNCYQVINAGMAGSSPISEYLYFKREFIKLNPDIVILQLFANDVFEDNKTRVASIVDKYGFPLKLNMYFIKKYLENPTAYNKTSKVRDYFYKFEKSFLRKSIFFQIITRAGTKFYKKSKIHQYMTNLPEFNDGNQFFIIQDQNSLFQDKDFRTKGWENTRKYLLAIKELAEQNGAQFFIFFIPPEAQLNLENCGLNTRLYFAKRPNFYLNKLLKGFSNKEDINYLDLVTIFERNKTKGLYFDRDGHLTKQGNRVVSQGLFGFLLENNLLR